jgi:L-ascorbate metabolism protein UlaG (beta-lactamase superfamily)
MRKKARRLIVLKIVILIILLLGAVNLFFLVAPQFGGRPSKERLEKLAINSNFKQGRFANSEDTPVLLPKSVGKLLRQQFRKNPGRVPVNALPSMKPEFPGDSLSEKLSVIWLGHSTLLIRIGGITIITDPVFSKRASPVSIFGPRAFRLTTPIPLDDIPEIDIVLLSHDHFDHLDYPTIKQIHPEIKHFIVPLGVRDHLERWGVDTSKIAELEWWESLDFQGIRFTSTPARHFSGRRKQDNTTLWCSWVLQDANSRLYYCGDSGYGNHFKQIGDQYGPFDITLMESGAYGKYWPNIHMQPEQSVQAHADLQGKLLLPIHWGKFNLAFHPWREPIERLTEKAKESGVVYTTPRIGELVIPGAIIPVNTWWVGL